MDEPRDCQVECTESDREGEISCDTYLWNSISNDTNELYKAETHTLRKRTDCQGWGRMGEGTVKEFGLDMST